MKAEHEHLGVPGVSRADGSPRCHLTACRCTCCDKRAGKHCGVHGHGCHVTCG